MAKRYPLFVWADVVSAGLFFLGLAAIGVAQMGWWP